ncbi:glutaredoxin family protein [Bacterioplanoides sp.]|uniref:glutaredoxin family protein n=1 Tax=Bacterioplanoides sp. TaxID=2066072 RepID=UPI003B5B2EC9
MAYVLYGTEACHLCELAQQVIVEVAAHIPIEVYVEDIAESEQLVASLGTRIPVLKDEQSGRELDWPFNHDELFVWLNHKETLS